MIDFNGSTSDTLEIETGVPQGSVLRPFLFSVYINDLPTCTDIVNMIMYADDTTLICDINGNPADEHLLNMEICKITDWLSANKLSLNVNKTKCMIFHSDKNTVLYPKLFINNIEIERVDYFNFLGLQLHHTLKARCTPEKLTILTKHSKKNFFNHVVKNIVNYQLQKLYLKWTSIKGSNYAFATWCHSALKYL